MRRTWIAVGVFAAVGLSACAPSPNGGDGQPPATQAPSEKPLPAGWAEFRAALAGIDPAQGEESDERVYRDVLHTCDDMVVRKVTEAIVVKNAASRWDVDQGKAVRIVAAIREHIDCASLY